MSNIKRFFRRGNGELLGFVVCMPVFIFLLVLVVSLTQIALAKEFLEYAAYSSGRAAVVAENFDDAYANASAVIEELKNSGGYSDAKVEFIINGTSVVPGDNVAWNKGVFITVRATFYVDTMITWLAGERSASIVMMVERPAAAGGNSP